MTLTDYIQPITEGDNAVFMVHFQQLDLSLLLELRAGAVENIHQENLTSFFFFLLTFIQWLIHLRPACFFLPAILLNCVKRFASCDNICPRWRETFRQLFFSPISLMFPLCHQSCGWLAARLINWPTGRLASLQYDCDWLSGRATGWTIDWLYNYVALLLTVHQGDWLAGLQATWLTAFTHKYSHCTHSQYSLWKKQHRLGNVAFSKC